MSQKKHKVFLTGPEIRHIQFCLDDMEKQDCYYGPLEQFLKRHVRINAKMKEALETT